MDNTTQTKSRGLPALSEKTISTLQTLREADTTKFHALVAHLRKEKWPLRAISEGLGVSRSIVSVWEKKGQENYVDVYDLSEPMPKDLPRKLKPVYSSYTLSDEQKDKLAELTEQASTVRRFTDVNAPSRQAASELEELLHNHREAGASLAELAQACGVSRRAVAQRLEKRTW